MSITLADLKQHSRERADMVNNDFISDSELTSYINHSIAELHDMMVQSYGSDYTINQALYTLVTGNDPDNDGSSVLISTLIPANDFYKLVGIDAKINSQDWSTLRPYSFNERNRFQRFGVWDRLGITSLRYRMIGNTMRFVPSQTGNIPLRIWYIPVAPILSADTDTLDDLNQYSEYVIVDAAIKMLQKEESDPSVLMAQKQALKRRIEEAAQNRDAGKPESVSDIYAEDDFYWF